MTLTGVVAECLNAPNKENCSAFNFMDCTVKIFALYYAAQLKLILNKKQLILRTLPYTR